MTEEKNEEIQDSPEILDEETKKILGELEAQGHFVEGFSEKKEEPKTEEVKPEETKEEVPPAEETADTSTEEEADKKFERTPKFMPAWQHKVAESKWQKREEELLNELAKAKEASVTKGETQLPDEELDSFAEQYGVDKNLISKIVDLTVKKIKLPEDISKKLAAIEEERHEQFENKMFEKEFEAIMPLIKSEYGDLSGEELTSIKEKIRQYAYTEEMAKTPLSVIFKGIDDFRNKNKNTEIKKTAESGRGGAQQSVVNYDEMTEDEVAKLNRDEFAQYAAYMEAKEKK